MAWFKSEEDRVSEDLLAVHAEYRRLIRQIEDHAEKAPYPQVTERLRDVVAESEDSVKILADRLSDLGRHAYDNGQGELRGGKNCWERMVVTLEDYRELLRRLSQLWIRWDDERPGEAELIKSVRDKAAAHRDVVVDLAARSDPHALDS